MKRINLHNRNFLAFLVVLDLFMAISAMYVDWGDFFMVPWYLILFVPICPLYPLLLACNFWHFRNKGNFSQPLLHFTLMGTLAYGIMAYIFYPTYLISKGFAWYELGNMLWVTIYASQAFLLLPLIKKISIGWYVPFIAYFLLKDFLDRFAGTFSYERLKVFSPATENFLFVSIVGLHLFAVIFLKIIHLQASPQMKHSPLSVPLAHSQELSL